MFGLGKYNYETFTRDRLMKDVLLDKVGGPKPGEKAPDFEARTLDGDEVSLSEYRGEKNIVLTFGSATCPATAASIRGLNDLCEDYRGDDVEFLFCYVREAHPGERLDAHQSIEDKVHAAEVFRREEDVEMPIVIDDLKGSIHKQYGKLPNASYIIDRSGRVAFRCLWSQPDVIEEALDELLQRQRERDVEHAVVHGGEDSTMPATYIFLHSHRALERGGRRSIQEFHREMGLPGRVAVLGSRVAQPVMDNPGKSITVAALTAGVIVGSVMLGRYLRRKRFATRTPYDIESLGTPRRTTHLDHGDYEAVGI